MSFGLFLGKMEGFLVELFSLEVGEFSRSHLSRHCAEHLLEKKNVKNAKLKVDYLDFDSRWHWRSADGRMGNWSSLDSA